MELGRRTAARTGRVFIDMFSELDQTSAASWTCVASLHGLDFSAIPAKNAALLRSPFT
jgi:hypothetical protein